MTPERDDAMRDLRDAELDAAWSRHLRDEPPAGVDDAILAAAHRAVNAGPRPARTARWRAFGPLAAAAAVAVVAFAIVQLAPRERETAITSTDVPLQQPAAPRAKAEAGALARADAPPSGAAKPEAEARTSEGTADRLATRSPSKNALRAAPQPEPFPGNRSAHRDAPPSQDTGAANATTQDTASLAASPPPPPSLPSSPASGIPAAAPAQVAPPRSGFAADAVAPGQSGAPQSAGAHASTEAQRSAEQQSLAGARPPAEIHAPSEANLPAAARTPAAAPAPAATPAPVERKAARIQRGPRTIDDYVRELRELRADGREDDAVRVLGAFREQHDDAELPPDLRAWSRGVPRR